VTAEPIDRLTAMAWRLQGPGAKPINALIDAAGLDQQPMIEEAAAAAMIRPFSWLLTHVADGGVKLTAAGYLPPRLVSAAMSELELEPGWIGKNNREDVTLPVLELRQAARRFGLLRTYRGRLLPTKLGAALQDDPIALWWHLAARLPLADHDAGYDAGVIQLLLAAAGGSAGAGARLRDRNEEQAILAVGLTACGWALRTGPLDDLQAFALARDTWQILRKVRAIEDDSFMRGHPPRTPDERKAGVAFARAALRTWA
jgi:hypothetical protein